MSELSGEKIEGLLWEAGCELEHTLEESGHNSIHVSVGDSVIVVSETLFDGEGWSVDTDYLTLERIFEDEKVGEDLSIPESEEELVQKILKLGGED